MGVEPTFAWVSGIRTVLQTAGNYRFQRPPERLKLF